MEQRSEAWFKMRQGRITGSMVGAALGLDPNTSREEAMRRMVRAYQGLPSEFTGNIATTWGTNHEDEAREAFEYDQNCVVAPAAFVMHPTLDWLGASPDGYVADYALLEIKCPFGLRDKPKPVPFKSIKEQPHYYAQMQIQMFCTDKIACYFWQWTPKDQCLEIVNFDPKWIEVNLPKLIEEAEARRKEILNALVFETAGEDATICGRKLTKVEKAGSISYAKAIKVLAPGANLEQWRGEPSSYWMFK